MSERPLSPVKVWLTAVRPFAYTASVSAVALGLALAHHAGHPIRWGLFALTLAGVVCFHTAANLLNDCFDHRRGLDDQVLPMSGAVIRGWLTETQVYRAAMVLLVAGVTCGLLLVWMAGWMVLGLGIAGTLLVLGYTRSGFCLKYAGLGDAAIFVAFGVLPVFGTYWVQAQRFSWIPLLWSLPLVSYTVGILHANNWHDIAGDRRKKCRTVATGLGERGSAVYYRVLMLSPFALVVTYVVLGLATGMSSLAPLTALTVLLALPIAVKLVRTTRQTDPQGFTMLDGKTAQLQMLFGLLAVVSLLVGRYIPGW